MVGLNGAGKTTTVRALAGRLRAEEGSAAVLGHDPIGLPARAARRDEALSDAGAAVDQDGTVVVPHDLGRPVAIDMRHRAAGAEQGQAHARGLGACELRDLAIYELDLRPDDPVRRAEHLRRYLLGRTPAEKMTPVPDPEVFLNKQIQTLPVFQEGSHAEKAV